MAASTTDEEDDFSTRSQAFATWLLSQPNATISPSIKLADYRARHAGRGLEAVHDIPADADLFSIPRHAILSVQTSSLPSKLPELFSSPDGGKLDPWTALILVLIYEYLQPNSHWKPYLAILPPSFDTLMFWSDEELAQLKGCAVVAKIGKEAADAEFRAAVLPVVKQHPSVFHPDDAPPDDETLLALAHRMASTIMAYAFDIEKAPSSPSPSNRSSSSSDSFTTDDDEDEATNPKGLIPLADLLNADTPPNASLFSSPAGVTMKSLRPIARGTEILNDYGQIPRSDLLRRYGYTTRNYAAFDCVEIETSAIVAAVQAATSIEQGDVERRLAFLEEVDLREEAYDLVWPAGSSGSGSGNQSDTAWSYMSAGMGCLLRTLLIEREHYKMPARDPLMVEVPLREVRRVMVPVLRARLALYGEWDVERDAALLGDRGAGVAGRLRMAVEVRHGEMTLLLAALRSFGEGTGDGGEEPLSKKRRVG